VKKLNPQCQVPQFSEDGAVSTKINEYLSSAPVPTQKEDEVLALIGDKCTRGLLPNTRMYF
jgi:hypothetical protein